MQTILLAGQDYRLLSTRAAVLKKTGANVMCCDASEALKLVESEPVDLIVLCHSLAEIEAERIAERAHSRSEGPKVLFLTLDAYQGTPYPNAKFDAMSLPDPTGLIAQATELLQDLQVKSREEPLDQLQVL
jgi:hypothetical protein